MQRKGYTLIEVLIVIGILGLLAALILAAFNMSRMRARDSAIQSSLRQLRWQAELVYDLQGASYMDWSEHESVADELDILMRDINKQHQLPVGDPFVTTISDGQSNHFCVSAPLMSDNNKHVCSDATGEIIEVNSPCPELDDDDDPLRCSDLL